MSKLRDANQIIEKTVVDGYKKIEKTVAFFCIFLYNESEVLFRHSVAC